METRYSKRHRSAVQEKADEVPEKSSRTHNGIWPKAVQVKARVVTRTGELQAALQKTLPRTEGSTAGSMANLSNMAG